MGSPRWDTRTEPFSGFSLDPLSGVTEDVQGLRIKYRRAGSRGRFKSVVVLGACPADIEAVVNAYEREVSDG